MAYQQTMEGKPYSYTFDLLQRNLTDWSGKQHQLWTSQQRQPQKTKFPYWTITERVSGYIQPHNQKWTNKSREEDRSGGAWYFEDELIQTYVGDKWNRNQWQGGWTGGKILMTKQQASNMGLTPQQVINWYNEDKLFYDSAKTTGTIPSLFFEYRKDGSIIGKFKPPIIPPPVVVAPPPVMTPPVPVAEPVPIAEPAPVAEPAPESVPVGNLNPYQLKTTIDPKWILLAIVGVGILSAMIFIMRGRK